jgi:hypothetical protein
MPTGIVATTVFVDVLITETVFGPPSFATYNLLPSGRNVIPAGPQPTVTVAITVLVAVLITAIVPSPLFATYTLLPSGLTEIPAGLEPTDIVVITVLVPVLITETLFELLFATYTRVPSALTPTLTGYDPTGTVATTVLVAISITEIVLEPKFATYASPADTGVAVIVAITGLLPVFTAVNEGMLPEPLIARPMPGALFTQLYAQLPAGKFTAAVAAPFTTVWSLCAQVVSHKPQKRVIPIVTTSKILFLKLDLSSTGPVTKGLVNCG